MHQLYNLLLRLLTPFVILRLFIKSRKLPAYRQRIGERFSRLASLGPVDIWIHAVSLGEVIAVSPLIEKLLQQGYRLMVTTTTPTGSKKLTDLFGDRVQHQYLPYDLPGLQRRFMRQIQPRLILIMETEIWPNLAKEAKKQGIITAIINARLSEKSVQGYNKISRLMAPVLQSIDAVLAQSKEDAQRFRQISKHPEKPLVEVLGNIKFDQSLPANQDNKPMLTMQVQWGKDRPVFILASTHEDEETQVLKHLKTIQQASPEVLVLVVPRHPERFQTVVEQAKALGFITYRRSEPETIKSDAEVIVVDCVGELMRWYPFADVAFVGGSLVPIGGHNVLEPALAEVPVITGLHMHNFAQITQMLIDKKAIICANNALELAESAVSLLSNKNKRQRMVDAANKVLCDNQGALQGYQDWIDKVLGSAPKVADVGNSLSAP